MTVYCVIHDALEETPEGSIQCFECKHVFPSPGALVADWNALQQQIVQESKQPHPFDQLLPERRNPYEAVELSDVDDVPFCPHCLHDF